MLFVLLMLGMFLRKREIITAQGEKCITDLAIYITLPAVILESFQIEFNWQILMRFLTVFLVACGIQLGSGLLNLVLYKNQPEERRKVLKFATLGSNSGLLGTPVAEGIWGAEGLTLASIFLVPVRTVMWSVGMGYFTSAPNLKALAKKALSQPVILATIFGLVQLGLQFKLPGVAALTVEKLADANTGLAMLVVGSILAKMDWRTVAEKTVLFYAFIRLFFIPGLVLAGCMAAGVGSLVTQLSVVLAGMPAACNTALLAEKYEGDSVFASKCVVFTTLLSMVTIPLWCIAMSFAGV
ncbi:MAG: AEC family transporter [Oscillospiraceae bacterium]|nr:AEC family transporter [Oscillospiraceae bacterium]